MFQWRDIIDRNLVQNVQAQLDSVIKTPPNETGIDIWIESSGGDAHATYKLTLELRSRCCQLRAVVLDYAKSAATLLILGVDGIFMGAAAELGPLDVQIEHPNREGRIVSGLDVAGALEFLGQTAVEMVLSGGGSIVTYTALSRSEVLQQTLNFTAQFLHPIVEKLDPHLIHQAANQLRVAERYAERMLRSRALPPDRHLNDNQTRELTQRLVSEYPAHEFIISRDEARELGLPVFDADEHPQWQKIKSFYSKYLKSKRPMVCVIDDAKLNLPAEVLDLDANSEIADETEESHEKVGQHRGETLGKAPNQEVASATTKSSETSKR